MRGKKKESERKGERKKGRGWKKDGETERQSDGQRERKGKEKETRDRKRNACRRKKYRKGWSRFQSPSAAAAFSRCVSISEVARPPLAGPLSR